MADQTLKLKIKAIPETKQAINSIKKDIKTLGGTQTGISSSGGQVVGISQALQSKKVEKSLASISNILKDIRKNTGNMAGAFGETGKGDGTGIPGVPKPGGGSGKGLGGLMKSLGIAGGVLSLATMAFGAISKLGSGFKQQAQGQTQAAMQLGGMYGTFRGGMFAGMPQLGATGQDEATFASEYMSQAGGIGTSKGEMQKQVSSKLKTLRNILDKDKIQKGPYYLSMKRKLEKDVQGLETMQQTGDYSSIQKDAERDNLRKKFEVGAHLKAAYNLDIAESGRLGGMIGRFDKNAGPNPLLDVATTGRRAGMGGPRMKEFFSTFEKVMSSAVQSGSSASNKELLSGLGTVMRAGDERMKLLSPEMAASVQSTGLAAANLRGGQAASSMLAAIYSDTEAKEGESRLFSARVQAGKGLSTQNIRSVLGYAKRFKNKDIRDQYLNQIFLGGKNVAVDQQRQFFDTLYKTNPEMITREKVDQTMKEITSRENATEGLRQITLGDEAMKALRNMTAAGEDSAKIMKKVSEYLADLVSTGYRVMDRKTINESVSRTE
jgi:hypothetical protein